MYAININFGTGRVISPGIREEFVQQGGDLRTIDAPEYVPTGSHKYEASVMRGSKFFFIRADQCREKSY